MSIATISRFSILSTLLSCSMALAAPVKFSQDTVVPADHQCNYVNFHHNEARNSQGPGKCESDCDCDGMRSCTDGSCAGLARPAKLNAQTCNSKEYHYQEAWTKAGAGKCSGDCECDGLRTCTSGTCTGTAR